MDDSSKVIHRMAFATDLSSLALKARAQGRYCDVDITVKGQHHRCHRLVLCSSSVYFKNFFGDRIEATSKIVLKDVDLPTFNILLDYIYGEDVMLTVGNSVDVLFAASTYGVASLQRECERFIGGHITLDRCIDIWRVARSKEMKGLESIAFNWIVSHFDEVTTKDVFKSLKVNELSEILREDALKAPTEEFVYEAAMEWFRHHPSTRKNHLAAVLSCVRLPFVNSHYLLHNIDSNDAISRNKACRQLLQDAKTYQLLPGRRAEFSSSRTTPRAISAIDDVIVVIGGYLEQPPPADASNPPTSQHQTRHLSEEKSPDLDEQVHQRTRDFVRANVVLQQTHGTSRSVHAYSFLSNRWYKLASLPQDPGFDFSTTCHGSTIFVSGGTLASRRLQRFDKNRWTSENNLPNPRCSHSSAVVGDHIFLVGGLWFNERGLCGGMVSSINKFSVTSDVWVPCSGQLHVPVQKPATAVLQDKIYLFGGTDSHGQFITTVQYYDTSRDESCVLHSLFTPATEIRALAVDDMVYLASRHGLQQFTEEQLTCRASLPDLGGRLDFEVCQHRGQIFIIGGAHQGVLQASRTIVTKSNFDVKIQAHFLAAARAGFGCVKIKLGKKYLKGHRQ